MTSGSVLGHQTHRFASRNVLRLAADLIKPVSAHKIETLAIVGLRERAIRGHGNTQVEAVASFHCLCVGQYVSQSTKHTAAVSVPMS